MKKSERHPLFGEFGTRLAIRSRDDFAEKLRRIKRDRPLSETSRSERHAILALLWTRAKSELLEYPFRLIAEREDPPDFTLEMGDLTYVN